MCHWRRVRNNYKRCGHYVDLVRAVPDPSSPPSAVLTTYFQPDEMVRVLAAYSPVDLNSELRPTPLHGDLLAVFPQQYNPVIDAFCPVCVQLGRS
ncbi:hypothetical protein C8Q80DRAFT_1270476 [Daedaleopsis nitida]|nr:hypothetical protein C8Q80DRAFT_1270476 [Daedaleopsis nitida]